MDASYLSQQVNTIIGQLHGLFDEIGVSAHDRERREEEVGTPFRDQLTYSFLLTFSCLRSYLRPCPRLSTIM